MPVTFALQWCTLKLLSFSDECRCDNGFGRYGLTSESNCDELCDGDETQVCGGAWANSVYQIRGLNTWLVKGHGRSNIHVDRAHKGYNVGLSQANKYF